MKSRGCLGTVVGVIALLSSTAAQAEIIASDPKGIAEALGEAGYRAILGKDKDDDPMIKTKMSGWNVEIYFYGCEKNEKCSSIKFSTGFNRNSPMDPVKINKWNRENRFSAVDFDDEGDPFLSWDIVLNDSISQKMFTEIAELYDENVGDFGLIAYQGDSKDKEES